MKNGWIAPDKTLVIGHSLIYSGLLENHFRQPDEIRILCFAPRQGSFIVQIPQNEFLGKRLRNKIQTHVFFIPLNFKGLSLDIMNIKYVYLPPLKKTNIAINSKKIL